MRLVASLVLVLLLLAGAARGDDEDGAFREGRWSGGPIEDGDLALCIMTAHFETGGTVSVMLTADKILAIAVERKGWSFDEATTPSLRLHLDGKPVETVGPIAAAELVMMGVVDARSFGPRMGAASTLRIVGEGDAVSFKVAGSGPALGRLARCVKTSFETTGGAVRPRDGERGNRDPFALPAPRLFDQLRR
jgi:hypothetical protein